MESGSWTLQAAARDLDEVIRRALEHGPQVIVAGAGADDSVVVVARRDHERLIAPASLAEFLQSSPLAQAIADGELDGTADPFARQRAAERDIPL